MSESRFRHLVRWFALDLAATRTAAVTSISVRSANAIFLTMQVRMAETSERSSPFLGVLETDESYFGARGIRGKRGRGALTMTIVFGLLKRGNEVCMISCRKLQSRAAGSDRGKASPESVLHTDGWRGYDGLIDLGFDKQFRVDYSDKKFARRSNQVNGTESFRSFAERRLAKFNGIPQTPSTASQRNRIPLQQQK